MTGSPIADLPQKEYSFFENVYEIVRLIPYGKVSTYGAIATYLGSAKSARMVGWAMNNSHTVLPEVPAHRVLNRKGLLTGKMHFRGISMKELLESEGHVILNDQLQNFNMVFWNPATELVI